MDVFDVCIIGGGIAGLSCAYFFIKNNKKVCIIDKNVTGKGASWAAAGMLCPIHELEFHELDILHASKLSLNIYEQLVMDLGDIGLDRSGTIEVALNGDDVPYLKRVYEFQLSKGLNVQWLEGDELFQLVPFLSPQITDAILSKDDIQVDNRLLTQKIANFIKNNSGVIYENTVILQSRKENDKCIIQLSNDVWISADFVISAVGYSEISNTLDYENQKIPAKIFPVKGQMISLNPPENWSINHTIRIKSKIYGNGYIVPKKDRWIIGSTSEEMGTSLSCTAGGMMDILNRAYLAIPGLYDLEINEIWSGLRPSTFHRRPIVDVDVNTGIYHLNGLYRHGILLGPFLGKAMCELCLNNNRLDEIKTFTL